jgi:hypothetical protein
LETAGWVIYGGLLVFIGICGCGCLLILKLTKRITWPWIWVLSPLWIPIALLLAIIVLRIIVTLSTGW